MFVVYWCGCVCVCICIDCHPKENECQYYVLLLCQENICSFVYSLLFFRLVTKTTRGCFHVWEQTHRVSARDVCEYVQTASLKLCGFLFEPHNPPPFHYQTGRTNIHYSLPSHPIPSTPSSKHHLIQRTHTHIYMYIQSRYPQTVEKETINEIANKHTHKYFSLFTKNYHVISWYPWG